MHLIRKRRRPRSTAQYPPQQPYWDGMSWQYPHPGRPQPYWDGATWQYPQHYQAYPPQQHYPQQSYPPHLQQPYQQPHQQQQPPRPGAPY